MSPTVAVSDPLVVRHRVRPNPSLRLRSARDADALVAAFGASVTRDAAESRRLLARRPITADAAGELLNAPYPQLWQLVAACCDDGAVLARLAFLGDPDVDVTLCLRHAARLRTADADAVAFRIAARARRARERVAQATTDRPSSLLTSQLDILLAAGDSLVRQSSCDAALLDVLRYAVLPQTVAAWLAQETRAQRRDSVVRSLIEDPGFAFGSDVAAVAAQSSLEARATAVGYELVRRQPFLVRNAINGGCDALADAIGPALLHHAHEAPDLADYIADRISRACAGNEMCIAVGRSLLRDWAGGLASLLTVISAVRGVADVNSASA